MKNRNKLFLIGIILIILVTIILVVYFTGKSKYDFNIEKVSEINYHILNREEKYGVINNKGEIVVEPLYYSIQIPNPSKDIFVCVYEYNEEKEEYKTKVLNSKGEELYNEYKNIEAIPNETTYDGIPFEKTVLTYVEDEKYGLLSIDGKQIEKPIYEEISSISYKEGMLLVKKDDKYGTINIKGQKVLPIEYENIVADNYYDEETLYKKTGFIVNKKSDKGYRYGYIDYKGKNILKPEYTSLERITDIKDNNNIYLIAGKDGQVGVLKNKNVILNYEYEEIRYNSYNNVFIIKRNGKYGIAGVNGDIKIQPDYESIVFGGNLVNAQKDGELIILDLDGNKIENSNILVKYPTKDGKHYIVSDRNEMYDIVDLNGESILEKDYSNIEELENGYYIVGINNQNGIVDSYGKEVISMKYNSIFYVEGTKLLQANISDTNTISLIDEEMNVLVTMENADIESKDGVVRLYSDTENKYFSNKGKELSNTEVFPENNLYAKKIDGKWGFVDRNNNLKVNNIYDMVTEFNIYGFASIKKDGKWGSIDKDGNIVQEPKYDIKLASPTFIGKFYQSKEWHGDSYYTDNLNDKIEEEEENE